MKSHLIQILPLSGILSSGASIVAVLVLAWNHHRGAGQHAAAGPATSAADYIPVFFVTTAVLALLYGFYWNQSYTAFSEYFRLKEDYENNHHNKKSDDPRPPSLMALKNGYENKAVLAANRCAGNLLEQLVPFLVSMYAYATYVNAQEAARIGWAWFAFRSLYLPAYHRFPWIFASTVPAYACVWYMMGRTVYVVATTQAME